MNGIVEFIAEMAPIFKLGNLFAFRKLTDMYIADSTTGT